MTRSQEHDQEHKWLVDELKEKNDLLQRKVVEREQAEKIQIAIYKISEAAHTVATLEALYPVIHEIVGGLMLTRNFYIALYHPEEEMISFPYYVDELDVEYQGAPSARKTRNGITEYVLRTGQPLLATSEILQDLVRQGEIVRRGGRSVSWLGVPLKISGTPIGVIVVQSYNEQVMYGEKEKQLLIFVSRQIAMAIERKRAEEDLRKYREHLEELVKARTAELTATNTQLQQEIAERKRAEEALQRFNEELEDLVKKRTQQLEEAHANIVKLEKEALEIQMAGGFAHEMRNALAGAIMVLDTVTKEDRTLCHINAERLEEIFNLLEHCIPQENWEEVFRRFGEIEKNEEAVASVIQIVKDSSVQAITVTNLILEYARLSRTALSDEEIDLQTIIAKIIQEYQPDFEQHGISARLLEQSTTTLLRGNKEHVYLMLTNLVKNARDALLQIEDGRERFIEITMSQDNRIQRVSIRDNANGIPAEYRQKIFEPFFSTKPSTGTGLGLNFVSKLVALYNGTIDIESEVGSGTTVIIRLPVRAMQQGTTF